MKEIGEILKESREKAGVTLKEAAEDLNYSVSQLEAIESGDFKLFKDIFLLKCMITDYSKYLGLNPEEIIDEFNEYVFESTSKIPLEDIEKASRLKDKEEKIASPYTKSSNKDYKLTLILGIILVILIVTFVIVFVNNKNKKSSNPNLKVGYEVIVGENYEG